METWRGEEWRGGSDSWIRVMRMMMVEKPEFKLVLEKLSKNEMLFKKEKKLN